MEENGSVSGHIEVLGDRSRESLGLVAYSPLCYNVTCAFLKIPTLCKIVQWKSQGLWESVSGITWPYEDTNRWI